ncbi:MAG: ABC-F family ATP-binding cassette domain-containing protein [Bacteroidales bacterium]|nr:ABC-F family ATP-binding cassette domain-containing protein [Bacteroidales bacterium]
MISVNQLTVSFGAFDLFKEITFAINPKDRIGLVGRNGAGKSTLLKIIAGRQAPTSGQVVMPEGTRVGYLPQQMVHLDGRRVIDEARLAFSELLDMEAELQRLQQWTATADRYDTAEYEAALHRMEELRERRDMLGGHTMDAEIERTLIGLGFRPEDFERPTNAFSGGWRMRIELAKVLLQHPQVLLLDEPTNHLDIESIGWLEDFLKTYAGAVMLVSHDRAFLDNVTNRTVEISLGRITDYHVPYTRYTELRRERREQQMAAYRNQQKMIKDTEAFIERFRYKATKAVQVQSRIKQLDRLDRIEVEPEDLAAMHITFPPAPRSGLLVVTAEDLGKSYGTKVVFQHIHLKIQRGEKVAFVGRNGEGKSTLSKLIVGEIEPTHGTITLGHQVNVGYFAQNQDEIMDGEQTVFETVDRVAVGDIRTRLRDLLGAFLFGGEDLDKKVKVLSGGERSRLAMVKLLLEPYNLLLLDEPTNHLDIHSKDVLKQALLKYDGTIIIVSHDRDFLSGLTDKVYEFAHQGVKEYLGDVYDFLEKKRIASLDELNRAVAAAPVSAKPAVGRDDYVARKQNDRRRRSLQQQVDRAEQQVEEIEKEIAGIERKLTYPELMEEGTSEEVYAQYARLKAQQEEALKQWETACMALEDFTNREDEK